MAGASPAPPGASTGTSLRNACSGVVIVAHDEDTTRLERTLAGEGFRVDEVRGPYTERQSTFSASMRCLVNHANAWRIVATRALPTIVVEADFVPVKGIGDLPVPAPCGNVDNRIAYLYAVGPEVWDLAGPRTARGHGGGMVALLIPPQVASLLLEFFDEEIRANPDGTYTPFDSRLGYWLKDRGVQSYIPYRHYGEHGGIGNPEHARAGLGRAHRADVLQGRLAFLPAYAHGSLLRFWTTRARARAWGVLRLLAGRFLAWPNLVRAERATMLRFAAGRLVLRAASRRHDDR